MADKLITPKFRGSYVHLMKPHKIDDDSEPSYGITIVLPKDKESTDEFLEQLTAAAKKAIKEKGLTGKDGEPLSISKIKYPLYKDGDEFEDNPEYAGCWIIGARNKRQPGILVKDEDGSRRAVENESEIYSGAWYHASVKVFAWSNKFGKGVSVSLQGVLKVKDDEAFGSSFDESDFDEVSEPKKKEKSEDF